jgi:hypothetical protein
MIATLALTLALNPFLPTPQDTLRVGGHPGPLTLTAGADTVDNFLVVDGERQPVMTFVQTVSEVPDGYLVVQENIRPGGQTVSLDSVLVASATLATVWHADVTPSGSRRVTFADGRARGTATDPSGATVDLDDPVPPGRFDYSLVTLVADRMPLAEAHRFTLATWDITRGSQFVDYTVTGAETVSVGGQDFDTWRVVVDFGGASATRWVDRRTRKEVRVAFSTSRGEMVGELRGSS